MGEINTVVSMTLALKFVELVLGSEQTPSSFAVIVDVFAWDSMGEDCRLEHGWFDLICLLLRVVVPPPSRVTARAQIHEHGGDTAPFLMHVTAMIRVSIHIPKIVTTANTASRLLVVANVVIEQIPRCLVVNDNDTLQQSAACYPHSRKQRRILVAIL